MQVLPLDASLVVGCKSCPWMQVVSSGASLVVGCKSCRRAQVLSSSASLVVGCSSMRSWAHSVGFVAVVAVMFAAAIAPVLEVVRFCQSASVGDTVKAAQTTLV